MKTGRTLITIISVSLAVTIIVLLIFFGILPSISSQVQTSNSSTNCITFTQGKQITSVLKNDTFGQITEFELPKPDRWPNAPYVDKDGSVWFAEWALPGIAHFFPSNSTLIEYPISKDSTLPCGFQVSIWGVARSGEKIWITLLDYNEVASFDLKTKNYQILKLPEGYESPYTLTVSPDSSVWFTMVSNKPALGQILSNGTMVIHDVKTDGLYVPSSLYFVNDTLAYFSAFNLANATGFIYYFNPSKVSKEILPVKIGGMSLVAPNSISYYNGTIWVTQHGPSFIVSYNTKTKEWKSYPTSLNTITYSSLPYFIIANDGMVYFNEHYANKIAVLNKETDQLTEYSETRQPIHNVQNLSNVLTIAYSENRLWFTSVTSNFIGYLNTLERPSFSLSIVGQDTVILPRGSVSIVNLTIRGNWSKSLSLLFSDTENYTGIPKKLTFKSSVSTVSPSSGRVTFYVKISASENIEPGNYVAAITVTDSEIYQTVYVFITVR